MAKDFTELACWQLSHELLLFVMEVTNRPKAKPNRRFCEQADDAASSAPRNIAEGFGRYDHKEFAMFVKIALGSLNETRNNVIEAFDRGYISDQERQKALGLSRRAIAAASRLRAYLLRTKAPDPDFNRDDDD